MEGSTASYTKYSVIQDSDHLKTAQDAPPVPKTRKKTNSYNLKFPESLLERKSKKRNHKRHHLGLDKIEDGERDLKQGWRYKRCVAHKAKMFDYPAKRYKWCKPREELMMNNEARKHSWLKPNKVEKFHSHLSKRVFESEGRQDPTNTQLELKYCHTSGFENMEQMLDNQVCMEESQKLEETGMPGSPFEWFKCRKANEERMADSSACRHNGHNPKAARMMDIPIESYKRRKTSAERKPDNQLRSHKRHNWNEDKMLDTQVGRDDCENVGILHSKAAFSKWSRNDPRSAQLEPTQCQSLGFERFRRVLQKKNRNVPLLPYSPLHVALFMYERMGETERNRYRNDACWDL